MAGRPARRSLWAKAGQLALLLDRVSRSLLLIRPSGYGWQTIMFYAYILQSMTEPKQHYVGHTADLRKRVTEHNAGECPHTSKFLPWKLKVYVAFESIQQAQRFEKYLKSGSGRAFAQRHFWNDQPSPAGYG